MSRRKLKQNKIVGGFITHKREMRESAAWRALPDNARRVLDRLELEHLRHGGAENGKLICTYADFERAGLRRASVSLAIRQATALGFIVIERQGYRTSAEFRAPSLYRLTYVYGCGSSPNPTDDWHRIKDEAQAMATLIGALAARSNTGSPT